jgi:predicted lysophospholipase L1 biosynthesis ABC-type transport system permease subunit
MFWGEASPIGQRIRLAGESGAGQWLTIVGVIGDVKYASLQDDFRPAWYVPYAQAQQALGYTPRGVTYVLRAAGEPARLGSGLRSVMRELDPSLPIIGLGTMENVVHRSVAQPRFTLRLLGLFASLALVLGVIGLYGTLSNNVLERSREVGIRRALGAQTGDILTRIVLQGIRLTTAGLALGVGASLASSSVMRGLLFGVSPTDPVTLGGVALTMMLAAIAATLVPAIRAVRLDPLRVLRE